MARLRLRFHFVYIFLFVFRLYTDHVYPYRTRAVPVEVVHGTLRSVRYTDNTDHGTRYGSLGTVPTTLYLRTTLVFGNFAIF